MPELLKALKIDQATVEIAADKYNERYLAELRDEYKNKPDKYFIELSIKAGEENKTDETGKEDNKGLHSDSITNTIYHICRRLKDCPAIAGVAIPEPFLINDGDDLLTETSYTMQLVKKLTPKHKEYVYYIKEDKISNNVKNLIAPPFVLY